MVKYSTTLPTVFQSAINCHEVINLIVMLVYVSGKSSLRVLLMLILGIADQPHNFRAVSGLWFDQNTAMVWTEFLVHPDQPKVFATVIYLKGDWILNNLLQGLEGFVFILICLHETEIKDNHLEFCQRLLLFYNTRTIACDFQRNTDPSISNSFISFGRKQSIYRKKKHTESITLTIGTVYKIRAQPSPCWD